MRRGKIPTWVWAVILCCAAPVGLCQNLSGSLAAGTALSGNPSQNGNAVGPVGARSEVSASADRTIRAEARASVDDAAHVDTEAPGPQSGGGAATDRDRQDFRIGHPTPSNAVLKETVNGRLESGRERGLLKEHHLPNKKEIYGRVGGLSGRINARPGVKQAQRKQAGERWGARQISAQAHGSAAPAGATYSADFPDSTRGTALLSPPDSGMASPLNWSPSMTHGFEDLTTRQFLIPSLHAAHRATGRGEAAGQKTPSTNNQLGLSLRLPSRPTSISDGLHTRLPDPLADLNAR
jgi:hypothetical protein